MEEISDVNFREIVKKLEWHRLVAQSRQANRIVVEEFYEQPQGELAKTSFKFRGVEVEINSSRINEYFGAINLPGDEVRRMGTIVLTPVEIQSLRRFLNQTNEGEDV